MGGGNFWVYCQSQSMVVVVVPLCFLLVAWKTFVEHADGGQTLFGRPILRYRGHAGCLVSHKTYCCPHLLLSHAVLTYCSRRDGILMSGKREKFLRRA